MKLYITEAYDDCDEVIKYHFFEALQYSKDNGYELNIVINDFSLLAISFFNFLGAERNMLFLKNRIMRLSGVKVNLYSQVTAKNIDPAGVILVTCTPHLFARKLEYIDCDKCIVIPRNAISKDEWLSPLQSKSVKPLI